MQHCTKKRVLGLVGVGAVACLFAFCVPTLVAVLGGGYLVATGSYLSAGLLVVAVMAAVVGYGLYRRRRARVSDPIPSSTPADEDSTPLAGGSPASHSR